MYDCVYFNIKHLFVRLCIFQHKALVFENTCFIRVIAHTYRLTVFELYRIAALMLPYQPLSTFSLWAACPLQSVVLPSETFQMRKKFKPFPDKTDEEGRNIFENWGLSSYGVLRYIINSFCCKCTKNSDILVWVLKCIFK